MKEEKRLFYKTMWSFALPITIQLMITSGLNIVDSVMVGSLGVESIAAVGISNKFTQFMVVILQGFASGATIFSAQYWGKNDSVGVKQTLILVTKIASLFSMFFALLTLFFTPAIIGIFSKDALVISEAISFLRIISASYLFTALSMIFSVTLKTIGEVKRPTFYSVLTLLTNTFFNWILIFGPFGLPAYGIQGAAIATLLARIIQTALLFSIFINKGILKTNPNNNQPIPKISRQYWKITIPSIINHLTWTIGELVFFWLYTRTGTNQTAAISLIDPLVFLFVCIFTGLSDASSVMIGNQLGGEKYDKALFYAKQFIRLTTILSIIISGVILLFSPMILQFYNITNNVEELVKQVLLAYVILLPFKHLNYVNNVGILRVGGDTIFVMWLDTLSVWLWGIPMAFLSVYFGWPLWSIFFIANSHEIIRAIIGVRRTLRKGWLKTLIA
ncbi:MATE family efflux transporter [Carnobacterium sp.]|uniref:MATE family efflux transporter n=1 Tax=Carnobacterium sp. TaxID=48221 RepID=UPI00388FB2D0